MDEPTAKILNTLRRSKFRAKFHLAPKDREYVIQRGMTVIRQHARAFIESRIAPANPPNDGRQTPYKNHPVFTAQHATACCCRSCLERWHHFPKNKALLETEIDYIVDLIMAWIDAEMQK